MYTFEQIIQDLHCINLAKQHTKRIFLHNKIVYNLSSELIEIYQFKIFIDEQNFMNIHFVQILVNCFSTKA